MLQDPVNEKMRRKLQNSESVQNSIIKNVQFFDQTEGLELTNHDKELLNSKMKKITDAYNERLVKMAIQVHFLSAQIKKY